MGETCVICAIEDIRLDHHACICFLTRDEGNTILYTLVNELQNELQSFLCLCSEKLFQILVA